MSHERYNGEVVQTIFEDLRGFVVGDDVNNDPDGWGYQAYGTDELDVGNFRIAWGSVHLYDLDPEIPVGATDVNVSAVSHHFDGWLSKNIVLCILDNELWARQIQSTSHLTGVASPWHQFTCPDGFINRIVRVVPFARQRIMVIYEGGTTSSSRNGYVMYLDLVNLKRILNEDMVEQLNMQLWSNSGPVDAPVYAQTIWSFQDFLSGNSTHGRALLVFRVNSSGVWVIDFLRVHLTSNDTGNMVLDLKHTHYGSLLGSEKVSAVLALSDTQWSWFTTDLYSHRLIMDSEGFRLAGGSDHQTFDENIPADIKRSAQHPSLSVAQDGSGDIWISRRGSYRRGFARISGDGSDIVGAANYYGNGWTTGDVEILLDNGKIIDAGYRDFTTDAGATWDQFPSYSSPYSVISGADELVVGTIGHSQSMTVLARTGTEWKYKVFHGASVTTDATDIVGYSMAGTNVPVLWSQREPDGREFRYRGMAPGINDILYWDAGSITEVNNKIVCFLTDGAGYRVHPLVGFMPVPDMDHERTWYWEGRDDGLREAIAEFYGVDINHTWMVKTGRNSAWTQGNEILICFEWAVEVWFEDTDTYIGFRFIRVRESGGFLTVVEVPDEVPYDEFNWDVIETKDLTPAPDGRWWTVERVNNNRIRNGVWKINPDTYLFDEFIEVALADPDVAWMDFKAFGIEPTTGHLFFATSLGLHRYQQDGSHVSDYFWADPNGTWNVYETDGVLPGFRYSWVYWETNHWLASRITFSGDYAYVLSSDTFNLRDWGWGMIRIKWNLPTTQVGYDPSIVTPENFMARCDGHGAAAGPFVIPRAIWWERRRKQW